MKVVGLSGAQGAGKTTLLEEVKSRGWKVDDFKVSRAVQESLGWDSLGNVTKDPLTMTAFQEAVLQHKLQRDQELAWGGGEGLILTERTFADIYAYATYWSWELVDQWKWTLAEAAGWLHSYTQRCIEAQRLCYNGTIMLPYMSHVQWQTDVKRADKASIGIVWENMERFVERQELIRIKRLVVSAKSVEDRATEVTKFLEAI